MANEAELRALLAKAERVIDSRGNLIAYRVFIAPGDFGRITAALAENDDDWIKCSERLPEPHKRVLCQSDFKFVGGYEPDKNAFGIVNDVYVPVQDVTHWRPLPPLPERKV